MPEWFNEPGPTISESVNSGNGPEESIRHACPHPGIGNSAANGVLRASIIGGESRLISLVFFGHMVLYTLNIPLRSKIIPSKPYMIRDRI